MEPEKNQNQDQQNTQQIYLEGLSNIQSQIQLLQSLITGPQPQQRKKSYSEEDLQQLTKEQLIEALKQKNIQNENLLIQEQMQRTIEQKIRKHSAEIKIFKEKLDIHKVVITGGPCAGKTTALTTIAGRLRETGYTVFIVPEAATMIFSSGGDLNLNNYTDQMKIKFQYYLLMLQISLEDIMTGLATTNEHNNKIVILSDRGTMDGSAYLSKELWETMLDQYDLSVNKICNQRYDLIIHLSTTADGAEKYYTLENNEARHESLQFACDIDKKLVEAYIEHSNFVQIHNKDCDSFQEKINHSIKAVFKYLGLPTSVTFYNKFLIANPNNEMTALLSQKYPITLHNFDISDIVFFKNQDQLVYYRSSSGLYQQNFIRCEKSCENGVYTEKRRQVALREYLSMKNLQTENKYNLKKKRSSFMWKNTFINLDTLNIDGLYFSVCTIQGYKKKKNMQLPEIIEKNIVMEISDNIDFFTELMAKDQHTDKLELIKDYKEKLSVFKN